MFLKPTLRYGHIGNLAKLFTASLCSPYIAPEIMRRPHRIHLFLLFACALPGAVLGLMCTQIPLHAQILAREAPPQQLVHTFITVTGSPLADVNRDTFRVRLTGELEHFNPELFRDAWPLNTKVIFDSIFTQPAGQDNFQRTVLYVTTYSNGQHENLYLYCRKDSIWKLEAFRRFPTFFQRKQIRESLREIDSTSFSGSVLLRSLRRILMTDRQLAELLPSTITDAEEIARGLSRSSGWSRLYLKDFDFTDTGEYRVLDDDIPAEELSLYTMKRSTLMKLQQFGILRFEEMLEHPGVVLLILGMAEQNKLGFLYCENPENLPLPSHNNFIMIKPVTKNWWIFKKLASP